MADIITHNRYNCICGQNVQNEPLDKLITAYITEGRNVYHIWWHKNCYLTIVKEI